MSEKHAIDSIRFEGGSLCLDFVNTVHKRPAGPDDEYLRELGDFLRWSEKAGLLKAHRVRPLARTVEAPERLLTELKALRELLHRIFDRVSQGHPPADKDLKAFARYAGASRTRQELSFERGRAHWRCPTPRQADLRLVDPILMDADALLTGDRLDRVKRCEPDEGCGWLFLDLSKNRSRRWCSMDTCGSAAKARAWYHRNRKK